MKKKFEKYMQLWGIKMEVVRIIQCFGTLNVGGAETLMLNIFNYLNKDKFTFDFLVFNDQKGYYDKKVQNMGGKIFYLPSLSDIGVIKFLKNLIEFFKKYHPDVVHSHMDWQGGFISYAAHKAGIKKIIVHAHANQVIFKRNFIYRVLIDFNKILIRKFATDCLACSKTSGESLFCKDFTVLINGIDTAKFTNPSLDIVNRIRNELNIQTNDIVLGTVGTLSSNKNQAFLINLMDELRRLEKRFKLIIVGDGEEKKHLEDMIYDFNLEESVFLIGVSDKIPELMNVFDIFLLPSKSEGLGIVAIEAQICGLPCILSTGVPPEVNMHLNSLLFLPLDIEKWLAAIESSNFKRAIVKLNQVINSQFDIRNTCQFLENIYR